MQRCERWKYWGIQPCSDMTGGSTDQAKSGVDAWLHIDMHGPLRVQQPLCHPDKRSQHIRRGLSHHQDLARWVEPMQLQMRTCTIDVVWVVQKYSKSCTVAYELSPYVTKYCRKAQRQCSAIAQNDSASAEQYANTTIAVCCTS